MNTQRSVRLVRNQSINLTTGVVTESDNRTVNEGIMIRKAAWIDGLLRKNDLQGLAYMLVARHSMSR